MTCQGCQRIDTKQVARGLLSCDHNSRDIRNRPSGSLYTHSLDLVLGGTKIGREPVPTAVAADPCVVPGVATVGDHVDLAEITACGVLSRSSLPVEVMRLLKNVTGGEGSHFVSLAMRRCVRRRGSPFATERRDYWFLGRLQRRVRMASAERPGLVEISGRVKRVLRWSRVPAPSSDQCEDVDAHAGVESTSPWVSVGCGQRATARCSFGSPESQGTLPRVQVLLEFFVVRGYDNSVRIRLISADNQEPIVLTVSQWQRQCKDTPAKASDVGAGCVWDLG